MWKYEVKYEDPFTLFHNAILFYITILIFYEMRMYAKRSLTNQKCTARTTKWTSKHQPIDHQSIKQHEERCLHAFVKRLFESAIINRWFVVWGPWWQRRMGYRGSGFTRLPAVPLIPYIISFATLIAEVSNTSIKFSLHIQTKIYLYKS